MSADGVDIPMIAAVGGMLYRGSVIVVNSAGKAEFHDESNGGSFAGFMPETRMVRADDDIIVRRPDRVWLPFPDALQTDCGHSIYATGDDQTLERLSPLLTGGFLLFEAYAAGVTEIRVDGASRSPVSRGTRFRIAGDSTIYQVTADVAGKAANTDRLRLPISPVLQQAAANNAALSAVTGFQSRIGRILGVTVGQEVLVDTVR